MNKPTKKAGFISFNINKIDGLPHSANLVLENGIFARTSRIVCIKPDEKTIETLNTIYHIVLED